MQKLFSQLIKSNLAVVILFSSWAVLIYSNTFNAPFYYDDYRRIVANPDIQWEDLSFERVKGLVLWRPVADFTFALNYYFGGLEVSGYHYVNLGIHIITAFIFFLFLKTVLALPHFDQKVRDNNCEIALIASSLWLSSPIQISAVTYIVQRMAALAAMFYISAVYFYLKGRLSLDKKRYAYLFLTLLSILLAFGTKQNSFTLPIFIIFMEVMLVNNGDIRFLFSRRIFIILVIASITYILILLYLYYPTLEIKFNSWFMSWFIYSIEMRFFTGIRAIAFYVIHLFFPVPSRLSIEHDFEVSRSLFEPSSTVLILPILMGNILFIIFYFKKYPLFSFFNIWFFGNLVIETFHPYLITVFEHRLYLPSMGFFAITAIALHNLIKSVKRIYEKKLFVAIVFIIAILFSINTYVRNNVWKDPYSLWNDVIRKSPNIPLGYLQVGLTYFKDEDYEDALKYFLKAISISPRDPSIRQGLGAIYFNLKEYSEAIKEFNYAASLGYDKSNRIFPSMSYYFSRIAKNYYGHGRVDEAIKVIDNALIYDPDEPKLKELKEKMLAGTITPKEIMAK